MVFSFSFKINNLKFTVDKWTFLLYNLNMDESVKDLLKAINLNRNSISSYYQRFEENETDILYRYYHHSFKVFNYIKLIEATFHQLSIVQPHNSKFDKWFLELYESVIAKEWTMEVNDRWVEEVSPIVHLYLQLKTILKSMVLCPSNLSDNVIDLNTALVLELYGLR